MVGNAQTNIITILVPLSVEELFAEVIGLLCQFCSRSSRCSGLVLIRGLAAAMSLVATPFAFCIIDQSVCQRRYTTQVTVAVANDGAGQVVVILICALPIVRLTRPDQAGRDREGFAVISYTLRQIRNCKLCFSSIIRLILCRECLFRRLPLPRMVLSMNQPTQRSRIFSRASLSFRPVLPTCGSFALSLLQHNTVQPDAVQPIPGYRSSGWNPGQRIQGVPDKPYYRK